mgnify:FL=1
MIKPRSTSAIEQADHGQNWALVPVTQADELKLDLDWFGVVMRIVREISLTAPPFGLLLFAMTGIAPEDTTLGNVAWSVEPYIGCAIL